MSVLFLAWKVQLQQEHNEVLSSASGWWATAPERESLFQWGHSSKGMCIPTLLLVSSSAYSHFSAALQTLLWTITCWRCRSLNRLYVFSERYSLKALETANWKIKQTDKSAFSVSFNCSTVLFAIAVKAYPRLIGTSRSITPGENFYLKNSSNGFIVWRLTWCQIH